MTNRPNTRIQTNSRLANRNHQPANAPKKPDGIAPDGLTIERLAQLKVLAANASKFGLSYEAIRRLSPVELKPGHDEDLAFMMELGWVTEAGDGKTICVSSWKITERGRELVKQVLDLPLPAKTQVAERRSSAFSIETELEQAVEQSNALAYLLVEVMDYHNSYLGHWSEEHGGRLVAGINQLQIATARRLDLAARAVRMAN